MRSSGPLSVAREPGLESTGVHVLIDAGPALLRPGHSNVTTHPKHFLQRGSHYRLLNEPVLI